MTSPQRTVQRQVTRQVTTKVSYSTVDLHHEANSIEVENQRNINRGLMTKLASYEDLVADVAAYTQRLADSESARD